MKLRILADHLFGTTTDAPLTDSATSVNSAEFASLATFAANSIAILTLDPDGEGNGPEQILVTAHGAAATVVTGCTRGFNGTAAVEHAAGTKWRMSLYATDIRNGSRLIDLPWFGAEDYEFQTESDSLPAGYSWANQAGATYREEMGMGRISCAPDVVNGHNWRQVLRSIPSFSEVRAKFRPNWSVGGSAYSGLILKNSSTGKLANFGPGSTNYGHQWACGHWAAYNAHNAWITYGALLPPNMQYFRIIANSPTDWDILGSCDGVGWTGLTLAWNPAAYVSPDQIGFGFAPELGTAYEFASFCIEHLRFIA